MFAQETVSPWLSLALIGQTDPSLPEWMQLVLGPLGLLVFLLLVVVVGGVKKFWVFGWQYEECARDRDRYRDLAERATVSSEKVADIAKVHEDERITEISRLLEEVARKPR